MMEVWLVKFQRKDTTLLGHLCEDSVEVDQLGLKYQLR